jgi:hypothetical protein
MYGPDESWEDAGEHTKSDIVNDPLKEKTPTKVHWHSILGLSDTPSSSVLGVTSTPASTSCSLFHHISSETSSSSCKDAMASAPTGSLINAKAFSGSAAEMDNAERWLRYLNQYVQYRNLRDDKALTLFKLLLTDQAQDWLYPYHKNNQTRSTVYRRHS